MSVVLSSALARRNYFLVSILVGFVFVSEQGEQSYWTKRNMCAMSVLLFYSSFHSLSGAQCAPIRVCLLT